MCCITVVVANKSLSCCCFVFKTYLLWLRLTKVGWSSAQLLHLSYHIVKCANATHVSDTFIFAARWHCRNSRRCQSATFHSKTKCVELWRNKEKIIKKTLFWINLIFITQIYVLFVVLVFVFVLLSSCLEKFLSKLPWSGESVAEVSILIPQTFLASFFYSLMMLLGILKIYQQSNLYSFVVLERRVCA